MKRLALLLPLLALAAAPARAEDPATNAPVRGESMQSALPKLNSCNHLFSARIQNEDIVCFEGWAPDPNATIKYCAVFTNGALSRIVEAPSPRKRPGKDAFGNDTLLDVPPASYAEAFVQSVLAATNGVPMEIVLKREPVSGKKPQHVDWGLTAAFLAVRAVCAPFAEHSEEDDSGPSDKSIMETMNPLRIDLGMDRVALEERIGPPRCSRQTETAETIHYYGRPPRSVYNEGRCWLGIQYDSNVVSRVYTHRMLDDSVIDQFSR